MSTRFRDPTALEKTFMVRHVWESRDVKGMDADALKEERRWLAERFGCSEDSAHSICAHARIRFDAAVPGELSVSNAEFARRWVSLAANAAERERYQREIAEQLKVEMRVIREITDGVRLEMEELIAGEDAPPPAKGRALSESERQFVFSFLKLARTDDDRQRAKRDLAQYLRVDPTVILDALGERNARPAQQARTRVTVRSFDAPEFQKGGEHVDYDTENKEAWRRTWKRFLEKHTAPEERAAMRVLCLPAKLGLEISVYTDLGFRAENIVAVEGGDRIARAQFELSMRDPANVARWGGKPDYRLGKLEDLIGLEEEPFDVVSLDFLGQMCARNLRICSSIPTGDKTLFLMTSWTRRWAEKEQLELAAAVRSAGEARSEQRELAREFLERHAGSITVPGPSRGEGDASMGLANLSADRGERWAQRKRMKRIPLLSEAKELRTTHQAEREEYNLSLALEPLMQALGTALIDARLVDHASFDELRALSRAGEMLSHVLYRKPVVTGLERWQYQSMVSSAMNHEFHTDMAATERPEALYLRCEAATDFLLRCCETALGKMKKKRPDQRAGALGELSFDVSAKPGAENVTCRDGGLVVAKIDAADFLDSLRDFHSYMRSRPLGGFAEQCDVPRKTIE